MKLFIGSCTICLLISPFSVLRGQAVLGARPVAMGQASVALPDSEWSLFANPAMMDPQTLTLSLFGIRYYGLSEITDMAALLSWPAPMGVLGLGTHRYGFDLFSESRLRAAYKNSAGNFHYGVALNYTHVSQGRGYGSASALGIDLGVGASIPGRVWMGARVTNVNRPKLGGSGEELPTEFGLGFSYRAADWALFVFDVVKDVRFPLSCRSGVEITVFEGFEGRAGITTEPLTFAGGFGYRSGFGEVNIVAQNHMDLGVSPGLDLTVTL